MTSSETYDSTGVEYYPIPNLKFSNGTTKDIKLAYRSINPTSEKKAVVCTCFGGVINATLNFSTGALKDYHVIVIAMLGNGESSSPSNDPAFPADYTLRYQDCVNAQYLLVTQHLGISRLDVVVGFSMGGKLTGGSKSLAICLCTSHENPMLTLYRPASLLLVRNAWLFSYTIREECCDYL